MSSTVLANGKKFQQKLAPSIHRITHAKLALIITAAAILFLGMFLASRIWPFSEESVLQSLSEATDSSVAAQQFHRTYFPFPGCVLDSLTFRHGPTHRTFITIQRLTVRGSYFGLLRKHLPAIIAEGAHVFVAPLHGNESFHTQDSKIVVEELIANGTIVEFLSEDAGKKPLRFDLHELALRNLRSGAPFKYDARLRNPNPPGEISASGSFGPWKTSNGGQTPVAGEYKFSGADLSVYGGVAGILSSAGKFSGILQHINIEGSTDVPKFEVTSGGHPFHLQTKFNAYVDATNGDTFLNEVDSKWGRTLLRTRGSVSKTEGHKAGHFDLSAHDSRIEDILGLFVSEPRSPMSGAVGLKAHVEIPHGDNPFLEKVRLQGTFGIEDGSFSKRETQKNVDELSAGARGQNKDDPETVLTNLKGEVALNGGVAQFSRISFSVPGAAATMHGTYNIINHRIDLHGTMKVDTKISKTTSGMKALLLKVMDPFFKKKKRGEIVPIRIGGTYEKPEFGLDMNQSGNTRSRR